MGLMADTKKKKGGGEGPFTVNPWKIDILPLS